MMNKDFSGQNGFVWFTGVIANKQDNAQVGRLRVRIIGWHSEDRSLMPDEELPWAQILISPNTSKTIALPKPGDMVFGFFQDGYSGQYPVVLGVYPRIVTKKVRDGSSSSETLGLLESQLVVEKQRLTDMMSVEGYGEAAYEGQRAIIKDLETKISNLKSVLNRKPSDVWTDPRTQSEINSGPKLPSDVVDRVQGEPTIPRLGRGIMEGTIVNKNNKDLAHVCDFISEMQKNINLKKYTKALANEIREMIRKVLKALGFTDATGQFSWVLNTLKSFARELRRIQKEIIQPIIDFEKYVLAYITKIRGMITWLLNLPERFLEMLRECYLRLLKLIKQVLTDTILGFKEGADMDEFQQVLNVAGEFAIEVYDTIEMAQNAVAGAQVIINTATTGLLVPVSESEVEAANTYINSYTTSGNNIVSSVLSGLQAP